MSYMKVVFKMLSRNKLQIVYLCDTGTPLHTPSAKYN